MTYCSGALLCLCTATTPSIPPDAPALSRYARPAESCRRAARGSGDDARSTCEEAARDHRLKVSDL